MASALRTTPPSPLSCTARPLIAFHATKSSRDVIRHIVRSTKAGLELAACGTTIRSQNMTVGNPLPGFVSADKGGVVRIAELQSQGYLYLRP